MFRQREWYYLYEMHMGEFVVMITIYNLLHYKVVIQTKTEVKE